MPFVPFIPPPIIPHHKHHGFVPTPVVLPIHHGHHPVTPPMLLTALPAMPIHVHHAPLVTFWLDPRQISHLGTYDGITLEHGAIILFSIGSGLASLVPHPTAEHLCTTAITEAMVLFLMRRRLMRHVERRDVEQLLSELGESAQFTRKTLSRVKQVTTLAKHAGHPLAAGIHASVAGGLSLFTGLAVLRAMDAKEKVTAKVLHTAIDAELDISANWLRMLNTDPRAAAQSATSVRVGNRRYTVPTATEYANALRNLNLPVGASQDRMCRALAGTFTKVGVRDAAASVDEVVGASRPINRDGFRVASYATLNARDVIKELRGLDPKAQRALLTYERRNANRKTVIAAIEKSLGRP